MATAHEREYVYLIRKARKRGEQQHARQLHEHAKAQGLDIDRLLDEVPELVPRKVDNHHPRQ